MQFSHNQYIYIKSKPLKLPQFFTSPPFYFRFFFYFRFYILYIYYFSSTCNYLIKCYNSLVRFKNLKILLQLKFYNKNFNKYKPLSRLKPFVLTQIFTKKTHKQQIENFAKRVRDFKRPLYNFVSIELLRVNVEVRTCRHLSCSNSMITNL